MKENTNVATISTTDTSSAISASLTYKTRETEDGLIEIVGTGTKLKVLTFTSDKGYQLPAAVKEMNDRVEGRCLWNFKAEGFSGYGAFVFVHSLGEHVIALVNGSNVKKVIPLLDLPKLQVIQLGDGSFDVIGGREIELMIKLKIATASQLEMENNRKYSPCFSKDEQSSLDLFKKIKTAKAIKAQEKRDAERQAEKNRQLAEKRRETARMQELIGAREKVTVYTNDGRRFFGVPVTCGEKQYLLSGTYAVEVESYDQETGRASGPISVTRIGSGLKPITGISIGKPEDSNNAVKAQGFVFFEIDEKPVRALIVSKDGVKELKSRCVNSGTCVAIPDGKGTFHVRQLFGNDEKTLGDKLSPMDL